MQLLEIFEIETFHDFEAIMTFLIWCNGNYNFKSGTLIKALSEIRLDPVEPHSTIIIFLMNNPLKDNNKYY